MTSVANWLPYSSITGRIVSAALIMSSFHSELHSIVLLKTKEIFSITANYLILLPMFH